MTTAFEEKIYSKLRKVPRGRVTTYKELARAVKSKGYRAVGQAMHKNPYAPQVPCHRVVSSNGGIGGFASGIKKKIAMLKEEGVLVRDGRVVDFDEHLFRF
ncbi:MAG: MGMT family protein [archaeon]